MEEVLEKTRALAHDAPVSNKPGTKWTEADYAEHGYRRIKFTFPIEVADYLEARAEREGVSRQNFLIALLLAEKATEKK